MPSGLENHQGHSQRYSDNLDESEVPILTQAELDKAYRHHVKSLEQIRRLTRN